MPKIVFSIDKKSICSYCLWLSSKKEWFRKQGYKIILPNIKGKTKKEYYNEFKKIFNKSKHERLRKHAEKKWRAIEKDFFNISQETVGKRFTRKSYTCYVTIYGPGGSYDTSGKIFIRADKDSNEIIMHEMIHLLIEKDIRKNKINHANKERIVDSYFTKINKKIK